MEILAFIVIFFIAIKLQGVLFYRLVFKNLDYKCYFSVEEAQEGSDILLIETVQNKKLFPIPWLKVEIHSSRWLDFAGAKSVVSQENRHVTSNFLLRSYQKTTRRWNLKCLKRGVYNIGNVSLVSGDLLGLKSNSIPVAVDANLVVYPQIVDIDKMFVPANFLQGDTIVRRWVVDDPFMVCGVREYLPYDSMDKIHWRATAKEGHLMVKKNDFTSQVSLTVILNIQTLENEYHDVVHKDLAELAIKVSASLLDKSLSHGFPIRLATNGGTTDDQRQMIFTGEAAGRDHVSELLKILAKLELKSIKNFEVFLRDITSNIKNNYVAIITSYVNEEIYDAIRFLKSQKNEVYIYLMNPVQDTMDLPGDINIYYIPGVGETDAGQY